MFDMDELLSKGNQRRALDSFRNKRDGAGPDGIRVSELDEYWKANGALVLRQIRQGAYEPGIDQCFEASAKSGKRREIASINVVDRLVQKLIQLKLQRYLEPTFLPRSFAYQEGKGTVDAAMLIRDYATEGKTYLCELDIRDFFGSIRLGRMKKLLAACLDVDVVTLIMRFLTCEVERDGRVGKIERGLLQGGPMSPVLSNLYLHGLDQRLEEWGFSWMRFSDNVYVCCTGSDEASLAYERIRDELGQVHQLAINKKKSGVYRTGGRRVLGYDLVPTQDGSIEVHKHTYRRTRVRNTWETSALRKEHGAYHIVQDGVINRKDYSLLFENEDERHHIPIGITEQLNIYGNVTISPEALAIITRENIRLAYMNKYGELMSTYVPESHSKSADVFLRQCSLYNDERWRLDVARRLQIAGIHNMRENMRYYARRGRGELAGHVSYLSACVSEANESKDVASLMMVEARARKRYYDGFSIVVEDAGFGFSCRTRRPPRDPCNALISFGNTVLYNVILQMIWKTSLDPKIGVVHATNRRSFSLNLDFADLFKPVIVDRVIFSLVNRHEIKTGTHFCSSKSGGTLLSPDGKRIFLQKLDEKLDSRIGRKGRTLTYRQIMADELAAFQRLVRDGEKYKPYKYY